MLRPIERTILVSVGAAQGGLSATVIGNAQFPDVPELRAPGTMVYGIIAHTVATISAVQGNAAGIPSVAATDAVKILCTFKQGTTEISRQIPFFALLTESNGGIWKEYVPIRFNPTGSFITFTQAATAAGVFQVPFTIIYSVPKA